MKKKKNTTVAILFALILLSSCAQLNSVLGTSTAPTTPPQSSTTSVLENIFATVMGNQPLTEERMIGQWNYAGTSVAFQSENLLKKAGGEVVSTQIESKFDKLLQGLSVKSTNTYFVFKDDKTYEASIAGIKLSGKYSLVPEKRKVHLTYLMGLATMDADVVLTNDRMQLLMEADTMLKLMKTLSKFTNNSSIAVLGKMADMYDGLLLGFDMKR